MKSFNRVYLMGYLGQTPELLHSKEGKPYTRLSVATRRGEEITDWHCVFVWGQQAESCTQYLRKGSLVFVEGSLTYWRVAQEEPYKNAVTGHSVKFLSPAKLEPAEGLDNPETPRNHNAVAHPA